MFIIRKTKVQFTFARHLMRREGIEYLTTICKLELGRDRQKEKICSFAARLNTETMTSPILMTGDLGAWKET